MRQYLDLLKRVLSNGDPQYNARTGQLMIVSAGDQSIYDLREGFPQCTTKSSVPIRWVGEEIFWMLRGERNAKSLYNRGVDIWNRNAFQHYLIRNGLEKKVPKNTVQWNEDFRVYQERMLIDPNFNLADSDLGPVYGWQWRHWPDSKGGEIDQIKKVVEGLQADKGSRYHLFTAWNPVDIAAMALGPCHMLAHFTVTRDRDLDVHMFQRSCDSYLGVPFNIVQYALINHLFAMETDLVPRKFIHTYSNIHIYVGVPPRSTFLADDANLTDLQTKVKGAIRLEDYLDIKEWYLKHAPAESEGNERKDHVPFALEQLSKEPQPLPRLHIHRGPLFEIIQKPAKEVLALEGYTPLKWDSKAVMAA